VQSSSDRDGSAPAGERLAALLEHSRQAARRHVEASAEGLGSGSAGLGGGPSPQGRWVPTGDDVQHTRRAAERVADSTPILLRRLGVAPRSVLMALAVALLVAAGALLRVATADGSATQVPVGRRTPSAESGFPTTSSSSSGSPAGAGSASGTASLAPAAVTDDRSVVVHVVGQVARPGIVRLPAGSRVVDAVTSAGGSTRSADTSRVNLARVVVDGEQIYVPTVGEPSGPAASGGVAGSGAGGGPAATTGAVNLNTADESALDALPGVGPVLAQRILAWREQHGTFSSVDELTEVQGIGDKLLESLRPLVTVP
jgi:competence protein ComEA